MNAELTPADFAWVSQVFEARSGIRLVDSKAQLVVHRLVPRARAFGCTSLTEYFALLRQPEQVDEREALIDLLTTHETFFFREPKHFDALLRHAQTWDGVGNFRVWSAACSTGEEATSAALVLAGSPVAERFEIIGSDISPDTVRKAEAGLFPLDRAEQIRPELLQKYFLKGVGDAEGTFRLTDTLKARLQFRVRNLLEPEPAMGAFDVVFLRNVLIYFEDARRRQIVRNVVEHLKPGGLLLHGHAESVRDCSENLRAIGLATYRFEPQSSASHRAKPSKGA